MVLVSTFMTPEQQTDITYKHHYLLEGKVMKKSELKNIIKECVKEVIFEEGVLSGLITEVVNGLTHPTQQKTSPVVAQPLAEAGQTDRAEVRNKVLSAIGGSAYEDVKQKFNNPTLFEGTKPIPSNDNKGALAGVDPRDPGIDISNIPGMSNWGNVVKNLN